MTKLVRHRMQGVQQSVPRAVATNGLQARLLWSRQRQESRPTIALWRSWARRAASLTVQAAAQGPKAQLAPGPPARGSAASPVATPGAQYFRDDSRPVILFDSVCNLCNGGVNFILDWDKQAVFRLAALQSIAGRELLRRAGRSPDDLSSIVLVENDKTYIKSEAILRIGQRLNIPFALLAGLAFLVPKPAADVMYDQVANNRYNLFGYTSSCRLSDDRFAGRFLSD